MLQRQNCSRQNSAQANTAQSHWFREYLRENEFFSKTILDWSLGAQMASIHEIKKWQKSLDTAPLSTNYMHGESLKYGYLRRGIYMLKMCTKSCSFKQIKINWCYLVAPSLVSWAWRSPASSPAPPGSHLEKKNYPIRLSNTNHWKFELFQKKKVKKTINHWKIVCFFTCSTRWPGSHLEKKKLPSQSRKIYLLPNLPHQSIFKGKNLAINEKCSALSPSPPESHPEKWKIPYQSLNIFLLPSFYQK